MAIYLDNAATSWPKPESVYQAADTYLRHNGASPGRGGYGRAREAGMMIYEARETIASLFHVADPNRISFTCNATEALNIALFGVLQSGDTVVTTAMEHNAVARPLRRLSGQGIRVLVVGCDSAGRLDLDELERHVKQGVKAVVMTHASNVTGTLMPVREAGRIAGAHGALLIVDSAQTAGTEKLDVNSAGIDILAFSGHKGLLGPPGTGGIYVRPGVGLQPWRYGGTGSLSETDEQPSFLPDMLESGTINAPGIAALAAGAAFVLREGVTTIRQKEKALCRLLREGLSDIPGLRLLGPENDEERTAIVSFTQSGMDSAYLSYLLDQKYGIMSRGGLHCAPWAHAAIGTGGEGAVRFSPGYFNTVREIEETVKAIHCVMNREDGL